MRISWIAHKGKKILFQDYSKLTGKAMLDVLRDSENEFENLTSPILILFDYTDAIANDNYMDELIRLGKKYNSLISKTASVGVTGIRKILASSYNLFTGQGNKNKYFDNLEDAKNFLCE